MSGELDLDELERLADSATPGPWIEGGTPGYLAAGQLANGTTRQNNPLTIRSPMHHTEEIATVWTYLLPTNANAAFIARARTAVPELIAEIRRLRKLAGEA